MDLFACDWRSAQRQRWTVAAVAIDESGLRSGLSAPPRAQASGPAALVNAFTPERKEAVCFPAAPSAFFYSAIDTRCRHRA